MAGTVCFSVVVPKAFLPVGDSSFIWGVMIGKEGSSPEQMRALQDQAEDVHAAGPAVGSDIHADRKQPVPRVAIRDLLLAFLDPPQVRPPIEAVAGGLMGRLGAIPGRFRVPAAHAGPRHQHGRDEPEPGAIRLLPFRREFAASVRRVAETHGASCGNIPGFATVSSDYFNHTPNLRN